MNVWPHTIKMIYPNEGKMVRSMKPIERVCFFFGHLFWMPSQPYNYNHYGIKCGNVHSDDGSGDDDDDYDDEDDNNAIETNYLPTFPFFSSSFCSCDDLSTLIFKRKIFMRPHIISSTKQNFCLALNRCTTKQKKWKNHHIQASSHVTSVRKQHGLVYIHTKTNVSTQEPIEISLSLSAKNKCTNSNFYLIMRTRALARCPAPVCS